MEQFLVGKRVMWIFAFILGGLGLYYLSLTGIDGAGIDEFLQQFRVQP